MPLVVLAYTNYENTIEAIFLSKPLNKYFFSFNIMKNYLNAKLAV